MLVIQLTNPQGGALIGPSKHVNIIISANDHVAGILGFQTSSYIAEEGRKTLHSNVLNSFILLITILGISLRSLI